MVGASIPRARRVQSDSRKNGIARSGSHIAGANGAQQSFDPLDGLVDQPWRFAGLNLVLQFKEGAVGVIEAPRWGLRCSYTPILPTKRPKRSRIADDGKYIEKFFRHPFSFVRGD